ncbi:DNA/RNA polymerase [Guyanagaster necrorhizus]|uniref:DNA polymerase n=1 Tax=Guyanagaster necrorhizus TaxID=856835 RepID=A0A9P8AYV1_9AGAR|nr:DNA/RNA polymerase [Guyanagaster necrorhizus MCA 3950]KAG7452885.1 DNA/RNA polymerase [Guyanagaster necrorhizus MCA 3950]
MTSPNQTNRPVLRVQINQIDYSLEVPGPFDNSNLPKVPVLRIYGPSSIRKKTCLHIHQVYPYFFVEYTGSLSARHVRRYVARLTHSLNHAIAISFKRTTQARPQYIRAIILVKGIHFYGFHSSYAPFLKVYVVDPGLVSRIVTLLQSGSVMSTRFCTYESHLSYTLQFLSDFGLYGCGWIELEKVFQRGADEDEEGPVFRRSSSFRQSRMPLEVDAQAYHILNRHALVARHHHHELRIPALPTPNEPLVLSVRELWDDERRRRAARGLPPSPELPVDLSSSSRGSGGEWVAEARWWEEIQKRIENERHQEPPAIDGKEGWEKWAMTTFQSVEALWEDSYKIWKPEGTSNTNDERQLSNADANELPDDSTDDVDIDMTILSSQEMTKNVQMEEEAWANMMDQEHNDAYDDEEYNDDDFLDENPVNLDEHKDQVNEDPFKGSPINTEPVFPNLTRMSSRSSSGSSTPPERLSPSPSHRKGISQTKNNIVTHSQAHNESASSSPIKRTFTYHSQHILKYTPNANGFEYARQPPSVSDLLASLYMHNIPSKIYRPPYYSKEIDAPDRPREYAGLVYHLKGGKGIKNLPAWEPIGSEIWNSLVEAGDAQGWEYAGHPPSVKSVRAWLKSDEGKMLTGGQTVQQRSQIEGPTQANVYNIKTTPVDTSSVSRERHDMTVFSLEVFAPSRAGKLPDSDEDALAAVFYSFRETEERAYKSGIFAVESPQFSAHQIRDFAIEKVDSELDLINAVIDIVLDLDPDIVVGWDVQLSSWGYFSKRAAIYGLEVSELISRATLSSRRSGSLQWEIRKTSTFKAAGRHVLNVWRIMRSEQNLNTYTFENVVFNVLRQRTPWYSSSTLTNWYRGGRPTQLGMLFRHFASRTSMVLDILKSVDIITKTAEFARVFGVDFFSVISRGSQFKVESFMFRIAKPESFVFISPSKADVGKQNAAECMPLIMEPQSAFYTSPVVVLDFQSLYPSIMIAYNYCYSTCLGRIIDFQGRNKFGVTDLERPPGLLEKLRDHVQVAANGIMYVKPEVRKGLLGRMLVELLETRVMVKQAMKGVKEDKALRRILDARQLGLKYIANVTYGYTSATFSGRMPAVEIADSIVQSGRETLEKAIMLIDSTPKWGAKVVYGDTDSVFIYLHGKTKEQAFRIGQDIADAITALNPPPIKLKFEKVYLPCVLMAKKRYVGYKYESIDETEPAFDAKGIETVRRDGVPAQQKMTETCLKILFRTQDLSKVKDYCCRSWSKLLGNRASVQDFIFAKEVRMGTYSDEIPPPPGAAVAARRTLLDPHHEPQYGERVPYVISRGPPDTRLVDRAMEPLDLLNNPHASLDAEYYISRVLIPPLERIFNLVGANVRQWYEEMPKLKPAGEQPVSPSKKKAGPEAVERFNIDEHFGSSLCLTCGSYAPEGICDVCRMDTRATMAGVLNRINVVEKRFMETRKVCASCAQIPGSEEIRCESLDCPWLFARRKSESKLNTLDTLKDLIHDLELDALEDEEAELNEVS